MQDHAGLVSPCSTGHRQPKLAFSRSVIGGRGKIQATS